MTETIEFGADYKKQPSGPFTLVRSPSGLPAIELKDPSSLIYDTVMEVLRANTLDNPDYAIRTAVSAFLQSGEAKDWILVEFWKGKEADHLAFIAHLNERIREVSTRAESAAK